MDDSIARLFEMDRFMWTTSDLPMPREKGWWMSLAQSQLDEIGESEQVHEVYEWADLFLVTLHRLRTQYGGGWADSVIQRLQNHAHKGINHIKEKYGTPA